MEGNDQRGIMHTYIHTYILTYILNYIHTYIMSFVKIHHKVEIAAWRMEGNNNMKWVFMRFIIGLGRKEESLESGIIGINERKHQYDWINQIHHPIAFSSDQGRISSEDDVISSAAHDGSHQPLDVLDPFTFGSLICQTVGTAWIYHLGRINGNQWHQFHHHCHPLGHPA